MRVSFALVVWGEAYVRDFLDMSLPTLLAEGNLADTNGIEGSRFQLLTTPSDRQRLEASALFQRLKALLPVDFVDISQIGGRDKYNTASRCQIEAIRLSENFDALVLLYPDVIWARGSIRFAVEKIEQGALAVFSPAPAILTEPTAAALAEIANPNDPEGTPTISIAPSQLADLVLRHYHPMWDAFDWDGDCFTTGPACLRWNVGDQGWLIRCFHLHPVIMKVQRDNPMYFADFDISLDGEYTARLFDGTDRLIFATDSQHFAIASVRERESPPFPNPGCRSNVTTVARWAEAHALLTHRAFPKIAFRWHRGHVDEAKWAAVEARSQSIVAEIADRLHTPDLVLRAEDPAAYRMRLRHRYAVHSRRLRIALPPSRENRPRAELVKMLVSRLWYRFVFRVANLANSGPWGKLLRQSPTTTRLWQRVKPALKPKSEIDSAISSRSIIRSLTHGHSNRKSAAERSSPLK